MNWTQETNPLDNIALSALVAAVPVAFIFFLLIRKTKGYLASLLTMILAIVLAVLVYQMPLKLALASALHGALYGLFPICWIIIGAVFLFIYEYNNCCHYRQYQCKDQQIQKPC